VSDRERRSGVWGIRHSVARRLYGCADGRIDWGGGTDCLIRPGETYWRYYGRMAEAYHPCTVRVCERHKQEWDARG
jgi:hypothetical protein